MTAPEVFGRLADGTAVHRVALAGGGLRVSVLDWGAVIQDLRIEGHPAPLVLGFDDFAHYPAHSPYFGAVAGRYANRIAQGRFPLDGRTVQVETNFLGRHLLHGGAAGMGKRPWRIADCGADHVRLEITDPDGHAGFPGRLEIACTYRIAGAGVLAIAFEAETDAPTLCNLAAHSYFNLDDGGAGDVLGHRLTVPAERFLPVDADLIPTGEEAPVAGTAFDFRAPRTIGAMGREAAAIDHNLCLAPARRAPSLAARLEGASGVTLEIRTTEPGLQVYTAARLSVPVPGLGGRRYGPFAGVALEPQVWPDSPNHPGFPQAILRPGETYRQRTEYRLTRSAGPATG
jgi:aldose 1-epimerase